MYTHILIPIAPGHTSDDTPAVAIARKLLGEGGKMSFLTVLEEPPGYIGTYLPPDLMQTNLTEVEDELREAFPESDMEPHAVTGHSANSILDWAESHDVDCIVVSSHRPGLSDYFIGSTAARIVRHAQCPVVVLR